MFSVWKFLPSSGFILSIVGFFHVYSLKWKRNFVVLGFESKIRVYKNSIYIFFFFDSRMTEWKSYFYAILYSCRVDAGREKCKQWKKPRSNWTFSIGTREGMKLSNKYFNTGIIIFQSYCLYKRNSQQCRINPFHCLPANPFSPVIASH